VERQKAIDIQNRIVLRRAIFAIAKKSLTKNIIVISCSKNCLQQLLIVVPNNFNEILKLAIDDVFLEISCNSLKAGTETHLVFQISS
jgi:hypothetical protein